MAPDSVLVDARQLASGTIASLTGQNKYEAIDQIRVEFMTFVEGRLGQYTTWQDAWNDFWPKSGD
jgi:hypothetical protein